MRTRKTVRKSKGRVISKKPSFVAMTATRKMIVDAIAKGYDVVVRQKEGYVIINGEYYNLRKRNGGR